MRPLVPIDYSTEELQAVRETTPVAPSSSLAAAAEFAKRIGHANSKEERPDSERERSKRSHDRSGHRDRDRNYEETNRSRDETREKERDRGSEKAKTPDNKKLLDAKQLIDTIPKTKDELFSYPINWAIYDKVSIFLIHAFLPSLSICYYIRTGEAYGKFANADICTLDLAKWASWRGWIMF